MTTTSTDHRKPALPAETRVLSTLDGEPGSILSAYAWDSAGNWTQYEVTTRYGIEVWNRSEFLLLDEVEAQIAADETNPDA